MVFSGVLGALTTARAAFFASEQLRKIVYVGGALMALWLASKWWIARVEDQARLELQIELARRAAEINREVREYEVNLDAEIGDDLVGWYERDVLQRGWAAQPFAGLQLGESLCGDPGALPDCAASIPREIRDPGAAAEYFPY